MKISTAYLSECGGREKNDDTVLVIQKENKICAFVGDGLGGYDGGKIASMTAAEMAADFYENESLLAEDTMQRLVTSADRAVKEKQKQHRGNMKTTMVVLSVEDQKARWMHVGDTRLYHFQNGRLKNQTMDHSVSQVAVLMGEISREEIRFHEDRNRVLRALGSENVKPDISPLHVIAEKKEAFLLCTDGFWEYVYENEMEELLQKAKTPKEWLDNMKQLLLQRVSRENDNFSAAAVFCEME